MYKKFLLVHKFFCAKITQPAFTLAELLTATLVISIIMVALAPTITRRAHDNVAITVNQKQGLEIFATPGIYSFDVPVGINTLFIQGAGGGGGGAGARAGSVNKLTYTSNGKLTIPTGVSQVKFTITGAGGGGGGSNGTPKTDHCKLAKNGDDLVFDLPVTTMIRGYTDERDVCFTTKNARAGKEGVHWGASHTVDAGTSCTNSGACCWNDIGANKCNTLPKWGCYTEVMVDGELRSGNEPACEYLAATNICTQLGAAGNALRYSYSIPPEDIWLKVKSDLEYWSKFLKLTAHCDGGNVAANTCNDFLPQSGYTSKCTGTAANECRGGGYFAKDSSGRRIFYINGKKSYGVGDLSGDMAAGVRCYKILNQMTRYSGAGGASGAQLTKTINVLPNDELHYTIGTGGAGGSAGSPGSKGGRTTIKHYRDGSEIGEFYVEGGLGGNAATPTAHGKAYANGTSSGQTTPSGTCYAEYKNTSGTKVTETSCGADGVISYSGAAGTSTKGGNGGMVKNTGTIADGSYSSGGYLFIDSTRDLSTRSTDAEERCAKGQDGGYLNAKCSTGAVGTYKADYAGFGGGGGFTPGWAVDSSHFFGGGKGANGKVYIEYSISLPGGGGGSATRIGGDVTVNGETKAQEMVVKVTEGDRLVLKVGAGGAGGVSGQNGTNGEATVIGDNDIVIFGGEGGNIGSGTTAGTGGRSGYVNHNGEEKNVTLGLQLSSDMTSRVNYIKSVTTFKGQAGKKGGVPSISGITPSGNWLYGFSGGSGGAPYGIRNANIKPSVSCGGGIEAPELGTTLANYICTSKIIRGFDSKTHDPANNEYGGSGGGGGGVVDDSLEYGAGGNGAPGFLRIRWNEAEQE